MRDWLTRVGRAIGGPAVYPPSRETEARIQEELERSLEDISAPEGREVEVEEGETMVINIGPQHPSTHGVLRLITELDGETVVGLQPDFGFVHTGIEKNFEHKTYTKGIVFTDRMGYVSPMTNNLAYVMAVEKLCGIKDIPPRARTIRTILHELDRIASHLVWLATAGLELGALSVFLYCFREREHIMDVAETVSGMRMMASYFRTGGLAWDVPQSFEPMVRKFITEFPSRIDEYEGILSNNPIWRERTVGIGVLDRETALAYAVTGPSLRASGVDWDLRKTRPYLDYPDYDFQVPVLPQGDSYARYKVRIEEMRQSARIVAQALERLEPGPVRSEDRKFVPPPREELSVSMEAVIHHFKFWTEGFLPPKGEVYAAVEAPRGEMGFYIVSDGTARPWRVHMRAPSFYNLQVTPLLARGHLVADLIAIVATLDPIMGEVDR